MDNVFDLVNHDIKRLLQFFYFMWENNKAELQIRQIPIFVQNCAQLSGNGKKAEFYKDYVQKFLDFFAAHHSAETVAQQWAVFKFLVR